MGGVRVLWGCVVWGAGLASLVFPADAVASDVRRETLPPPSTQLRIVFTDAGSTVDRVVLVPGTNSTDAQIVTFDTVQLGGTPIATTGGIPCSEPPQLRQCVAINVARLNLELGGANDRFDLHLLPGPISAEEHRDLPSTTNGGPGSDEFTGSVNEDVFNGGSGDDTMRGLSGPDRFAGGDGRDTLDLSTGGPWTVTLDGIPNDGPVASPQSSVAADVEVILGGPGADSLTGAAGAQTINGGGGADAIDAGAGPDDISGGAANDTIAARDGSVDTIACGDGADTVTADWNDAAAADCESVSRSVRDDDRDGAAHAVDCNDANPAIGPGRGEIAGNGIDENCDGRDAAADRDGDGANAGADCNDANAAIRPGAVDAPGNGVDEDCNGADARRAVVAGTFSSEWSVFPRWTVITKLTLRGASAGAKLQVRCKGEGCPVKRKSVRLKRGRASLTKRFKDARLRPGTVVQLRLTAPGMIGKVLRLTIRNRKSPKRTTLCLPPGGSRPRRC